VLLCFCASVAHVVIHAFLLSACLKGDKRRCQCERVNEEQGMDIAAVLVVLIL